MKEYRMNRTQAAVLITMAVLAVGIVSAGIVMRLNKNDSEFKPMETFPPTNVVVNNSTVDEGADALSSDEKPIEDNNPEGLIPPESTPAPAQNDQVQAEGQPSSDDNTASDSMVKPTENPVSKPTSKPPVDIPKDKPDRKPSATQGDSKLVPDPENPFKQPPKVEKDGLGNVNGSDFYQDGIPAGQGDKF